MTPTQPTFTQRGGGDGFGYPPAKLPNPAPAITSLTPNTVKVGGSGTLSVNGTGFVSASVVRWKGVSRATTFVNATRLQVAITSADTATAGTASVTVYSPAPGGGTSNAATFTITP